MRMAKTDMEEAGGRECEGSVVENRGSCRSNEMEGRCESNCKEMRCILPPSFTRKKPD